MCTSYLTPNGYYDEAFQVPLKDLDKIRQLDLHTYNLLKKAIELGDTYIITNAAGGWVEYSSEKYYPNTHSLLSKIVVISARDHFEKMFPTNSKEWKMNTFAAIQKNYNTELLTNIVCLGDSTIELEAGLLLASKFSHACIKTVKFKEIPKLDELCKELLLVLDEFNTIFKSVKNLTIKVERKPINNPVENGAIPNSRALQ